MPYLIVASALVAVLWLGDGLNEPAQQGDVFGVGLLIVVAHAGAWFWAKGDDK